jgi:Dolichyl-phosphate-mannose-protein mannosyltransferase
LGLVAEWDKHLESPQDLPHGERKLDPVGTESFVEAWLQHHLNAAAATVIAAGLVIRLIVASRSFLNSDEAVHYLLFEQPSAFLAYKASLTNAHPPLLFLVLHFWNLLGHSELMLRLPSVFAGTAFCWFTFKWIKISFSRAASLMALTIAAFSPTLIGLSAEVREYAVLLFFVAAALYYFEFAVQENSARTMWYFCIACYLAILSHYSAFFFVLAMGFYSLVRIADAHLPRQVVATWVIGQVGAVALYAILYVTQIANLKGIIPLWAAPYNRFYFHGGFADIFGYLQENTLYIFGYMFGQRYVGETMFWLWVLGVAILFVRGLTSGGGYPRSTQLGILLLLPFMALWGAAVLGKYPYVPARHTIVLSPFAIAAVSAFLASILGQKLWRALLAALLLMSVSSAFAYSSDGYINSKDQERALMNAALNYVNQSVPRNELILLDYQSSVTAAYYLCSPEETRRFYATEEEFIPLSCDGHHLVAMNYRTWAFNEKNFLSKFDKLAHLYPLKSRTRLWVFQTSWTANLDTDLPRYFPQFGCLRSKRFGKSIVIIPFLVGADLSAACEPGDDSAPHVR